MCAIIRFTFLEKDISQEVLEELIEMEPAIKMAEEKLDFLSSDPDVIELYKAREYAAHERANLLSTGEERAKKEIARNLLMAGVSVEIIENSTGLSRVEIEEIRREVSS